MELTSCLYECNVMHRRLSPKQHQFQYRIFLFALDLDELDAVEKQVRGFSHNRGNFYSFRDVDHLASVPGSLKDNVIAYLAKEGMEFPAGGRIRLVTLPRVFGYIFNPVSFLFISDAAGVPIASIAEVGNTFKEMKIFFLSQRDQTDCFRLIAPKNFYVSPFSPLEMQFDFKLRVPGEHLEIHIDDREGGKRTLLSTLTGRRAPLTTARLAWFTLKYPLVTLRVIFLIHWHALLLWLKGLPFSAKTDHLDQQRDVLRPHGPLREKTL